ncbi:Enolase [Gossypium arboreum]|uniref:Enolase n=2 Tax=Gossypium arboreum TaxID=29729 RepID=A0A0B0MQE9_GOSAR|nr:uncharacterized protein LOC108457472 [Gossypium arboreum]XP_052874972.1 uncharacterized protein LOC108457472 [Gossypium arboreum]KAK5804331.1 hypothetical protein PVK06_031980 [Gossypium arboreum]KHG04288.1 Enolase [Gossypium arboreum]
MGFGSKSERSSNPQQSSKTGKEKVHLPHGGLRLKNNEKLNVKNGITFPYGNLPGEIVKNQIQSTLVETKPFGNCQGQHLKSKPTKEDELVRYMSNLPGYLQRVDSSDNLQEKALNVGVLDWASLEKWKYHRKHIPTITGNDVSSTSTILTSKTDTKSASFSSAVTKVASANKSKQHSSAYSSPTSPQKGGIPRGAKPSTPKVRHYQDIDTASKSSLDQQKKTSKTNKSFGKIHSDVILEKGKKKELDQKVTSEMGNMSSNMRNHGVSPLPKETVSVCNGGAKKRVERRRETDVNIKDLDQKSTKNLEASSSKSRSYAAPLGPSKTLSAESNKTKNKEMEESKIDLTHQFLPGERRNVVLLPRSARGSFSEELQDGTLNEAKRNSFSYDLLQKDHFLELCSDVPHSCPLPSGVERNPETRIMAQGLKPSSDASSRSVLNSTGNIRSQGKCSAENKTKSQDAHVETLKILEEEMAELTTKGSRTSSPNRRFSFSLSRLSRSFSFKESSTVPQMNPGYVSVKSGPVRSDSSGFLDDMNREKLNGHTRTRSSPLRRVLDPLLKSKGLNSFRSTDAVQPSQGGLNSSNPGTVNTNESFQAEKLGRSMIKALLEVATKNGLPLFRFVVNDGNNMLATTMRSLASSAKGGSDQIYVFSSVSEIKKSGSWISKGNKDKKCGYIYNIIGQMKISDSHISDLVKESVLFSVEQRQADQASAKFTPSTELAAVVIKIPGESNVQQVEDITNNGSTESLATYGCTCTFIENSSSNITTAILPGGVHSLPNKGIPSPLIDRWRFGGLCDCGGWDVGCKLHILSNQNCSCCKNSRMYQACPDPNHLELYPQGEAQQDVPIFSLVPHKNGIYAIEFSSSITALQAFFISVTIISCRKSSGFPEFGDLPEGKLIKETMLNGSLGMDNKQTVALGTMPARYAPNPPHSPVGRV